MADDFIISVSLQLREHLRALRKRRQLTQAQLGELMGVSQARIAEIEANPGVVNLDQLQQLLSTLGASLRLHVHDEPAPSLPQAGVAEPPSPAYASRPEGLPAHKKRGSW